MLVEGALAALRVTEVNFLNLFFFLSLLNSTNHTEIYELFVPIYYGVVACCPCRFRADGSTPWLSQVL